MQCKLRFQGFTVRLELSYVGKMAEIPKKINANKLYKAIHNANHETFETMKPLKELSSSW